MNDSRSTTYDSTTSLNKALPEQSKTDAYVLFAITLPSFLLAGLCFGWYGATREIPLLLLGLVTIGMACDFLSHILGIYFKSNTNFLRWYARFNFWALCFGIPFTAYAGTFVLAEVAPGGISTRLADYYLPVLHVSVAFGALFLFARYRQINIGGALEFTLDKKHPYTRTIFILRRILLLGALVIGITVMIDGWGTDWFVWSWLFTLSFIATVPLHIMHKQIPSMISELVTQVIAIYGTWQVFVAV